MKIHSRLYWLPILGLMAFAITTRAQSPTESEPRKQGRKQQGERRGGPSFEMMLQRHDANRDGKLSREEFPAQLRRLFDRIDANQDGLVTSAEDTVFRSSRAPRSPGDGRTFPGATIHRDLQYARVGEKPLLLDLYLPEKAEEPLPVIVGIHGGGWSKGSKAGGQGSWLVRHGYAVAVINYRLSGEAIFPAQIEDCKAAVRWLRANAKKYNLDSDRIGATGHSAGGHLTSLLAVTGDVKDFDKGDNLQFSSRIQAACPVAGPTDFLQMDAQAPAGARSKHDSSRSAESRLIGGPIQESKEKVAKANPICYVDEHDPPFLIIHGDQDPLVPVHQAQLLHEALRKAGVGATLNVVRGAGHNAGGPGVQRLIVAFFDKHLMSAEDSPLSP